MNHSEELSVSIKKPELMKVRKEIDSLIKRRTKLRIVASGIVLLTPEVIRMLYENLDEKVYKIIERYMTSIYLEITVWGGVDAINKLKQVCGEHYDPNQCKPGTIRAKFGCKIPEVFNLRNGRIYKLFLNGIHRTKKQSELERDLQIARMFLSF